jgi:hypothetical protein
MAACLGINHLHYLDSGMLVVGYIDKANCCDASLVLMRVSSTAKLSIEKDLHDSVCVSDRMDAANHRYFTQYIAQWYASCIL